MRGHNKCLQILFIRFTILGISLAASISEGGTAPIDIPIKTWIARPLVSPSACMPGGCKHLRLVHNSQDGRIYVSGGDWLSSGTQETWSYSVEENKWILEYPNCGPVGDIQPANPDENGLAYDSKRNLLWMVGSATPHDPCPIAGSEKIQDSLMRFDPVSHKWVQPPLPLWPDHNGKWAMYDPVTDSIYQFYKNGGEGQGMNIYNITSQTTKRVSLAHDKYGNYTNNFDVSNVYAAIDVKNRYIYVIPHNVNHLMRYNMNEENWIDLGQTPVQPLGAICSSCGEFNQIVWDPINELLLWAYMPTLDAFVTLYIYHPGTNSWEKDNMYQPDSKPVRGNCAVFDPYQNVLLVIGGLLSGGDDPNLKDLFLYRYENKTDSTSPTAPSNLRIR